MTTMEPGGQMLKILALVDGSESSNHAIGYVIKMSDLCKTALDVHLLNVQTPVAQGNIGRQLSSTDLDEYYHDEGMAALASARKLLDNAKLAHAIHIGVGDIDETVAQYVEELAADQIVMGTRALGAVAGFFMGSVTNKVVQAVQVPIVLVK